MAKGCSGIDFDDSWKAFTPMPNPAKINIESIVNETQMAWQVSLKTKTKGTVEIWFPKSKCSIEGNILTMPRWLLKIKNKELLTPKP